MTHYSVQQVRRNVVGRGWNSPAVWLAIVSFFVGMSSLWASAEDLPIDTDALSVAQPSNHSALLAAAFGFQAVGSSVITVRTYDAPTGAILSEDSFDVNVKEEGAAEHDHNKGRIFAGGIGLDSKGKSSFMLRVYDAESGRFLWEGQLNLLKLGHNAAIKARAVIVPRKSAAVSLTAASQSALQTLFAVRAVNPMTGGLVWQDQFTPGVRKKIRMVDIQSHRAHAWPMSEPIGHIFDLVVRTYDRASGALLWEDSFEQLDRIEEPAVEPDEKAHPQAIPFWTTPGAEGARLYQSAWRLR